MQRLLKVSSGVVFSFSVLSGYAGQVLVSPLVAYSTNQKPVAAFTVFNQTGRTATVRTKIMEYFVGNGKGVYGQDIPLAGEAEANIKSDIVELSPRYMIIAPSTSQVVRVKAVQRADIPDGVYAFGVAFNSETSKAVPSDASTEAEKKKLGVDVQFTINSVAALYFSKGHLLTQGSIDRCYFNATEGKVYLLVTNTGTNYYKPKIEIKDGQGRVITTTQFGLLMPKSRGVRFVVLDRPDIASVQLAGVDGSKAIPCQPYTAGVTFIKNWDRYHLSPVQP